MKSELFKTICGLVFTSVLLLFCFGDAFSEQEGNRWSSSISPLKLVIPKEMTLVKQDEAPLMILLRHINGAYPTFNIIRQSESYELTKLSIQKQKTMILDSYRLVGVTDVKAKDSKLVSVDGQKSFLQTLLFKKSGALMQASVYIIPQDGYHYIVTYLDYADIHDKQQAIRDRILNSIETENSSKTGANQKAQFSLNDNKLILFLSLVIIIPTLLYIRSILRNSNIIR